MNNAPSNPYDKIDPQDNAIYAQGLSKKFGDVYAVQDANFAIRQGAIFGFIGPSGSGKTTTVRLLNGIYEPTSGQVLVLGHRPGKFTLREREKIGYLPQQFVLYPDLTVMENLNFAASIYGVGFRRRKRLEELLNFVELHDDRFKVARNISGGMQRRLALASTLIHDPVLLFLDEPTAGIDPVLRRKFWDYFQTLRENGTTLFVTTQYVSESAYCDFVAVMAEGRLLIVDTPDNLRRKAFGGDIVEISADSRFDYQAIQSLRKLPFVIGRIEQVNENDIRITVGDASTAIPALMEWSSSQKFNITSINEFLPPYDDVFVKLIEGYQVNA
jgi:ABC-2 type transport system ATP-binding protein